MWSFRAIVVFSGVAAPLALVGAGYELAGKIIGGVAFVATAFVLYRWVLGMGGETIRVKRVTRRAGAHNYSLNHRSVRGGAAAGSWRNCSRRFQLFCKQRAMSDSDDNLHTSEIRHVLFIDIVGYSKLLIEEQKERLNQLTEIVLGTAQVREATRRTTR